MLYLMQYTAQQNEQYNNWESIRTVRESWSDLKKTGKVPEILLVNKVVFNRNLHKICQISYKPISASSKPREN